VATSDAVATVRRFNRAVTQRVGALDDRFLARDRPLGQARVLWEIGERGCDVRRLRARLDLDSGYLSRLLRALETDGLVTIEPSPLDRRVRTAKLTARGLAERAVLDDRSDAQARSLLDALPSGQRHRLVAAMAEVERLMTAAQIEFAEVDPAGDEAQDCLLAYFAELDRRFDVGFDPAQGLPAEPDQMRPPAGLFLVARLRDEPVGCGGLKFRDGEPAYLKRMWVSPAVRGMGLGRRLLSELEARAAAHGCTAVRLETNRTLAEAIALYRSAGYVETEPFNDEPYAHHWFVRSLRDDED
jgi:DNA-binding MarR family transcriptional regulator/GNAT superfamily N-acetyltransferase